MTLIKLLKCYDKQYSQGNLFSETQFISQIQNRNYLYRSHTIQQQGANRGITVSQGKLNPKSTLQVSHTKYKGHITHIYPESMSQSIYIFMRAPRSRGNKCPKAHMGVSEKIYSIVYSS